MANKPSQHLDQIINELAVIKQQVEKMDLENKMIQGNKNWVPFIEIPQLIKLKRLADELSIDEFAIQLGINSKTLRKIENPKTIQSTSMNSLLLVCEHLGIELYAKG
ncbi:MAG: helix-turn-helix transcriptional regulator [Pseudomonadales bacterium]|nr:helix-turn-helix transcriptional regulator [Pseudomonadales bacterium]